MSSRPLSVFLCHSSDDKPVVRSLYQQLRAIGVVPWLDEENILPGQDWEEEIRKAVRAADVFVVCLSKGSVTKSGYIHKEIKYALDIADQQPEGTIFIIPVRLEACEVPERLKRWQWVNLFEERGFNRLAQALQIRATSIGATTKGVSKRATNEAENRHAPSSGVADRLLVPRHFATTAIVSVVIAALLLVAYTNFSNILRDDTPDPSIIPSVTSPTSASSTTPFIVGEATQTAISSSPFPSEDNASAANLLNEARNWTSVFSDTFDNNQHGWSLEIDRDEFARVVPSIQNGRYHLDVSPLQAQGTIGWVPNLPTPSVTDFYAAVDVEKQPGPIGTRGGLLFRMDDQEQFYMFRVNSDEGYFSVVRMMHGQPIRILIDLTSSAAIRQDVNRIEVIGKASQLFFFINGTYLGEAEDSMLPQGKINPAVHIPTLDSATYTFDNLEIRQP